MTGSRSNKCIFIYQEEFSRILKIFFLSKIEYVKAAKSLEESESPVKLAKIDATVEKELGTKYGVRGYPTLKFFKYGGKPTDYVGPKDSEVGIFYISKLKKYQADLI